LASVVGVADARRSAPSPPPQTRRLFAHGRKWRIPVLVIAGIYFILPLYAAVRFALSKVTGGGFSTAGFTKIPSVNGFGGAFTLSLRLVAVALAITLVLMVPTSIYVHLKVPQLRRLLESITLLPIVIPPVVLIVGVLQVAPEKLKATPYLLALEYAVLAMPFAYRSLDASLRAIDVKTLFEASRSLGGGALSTMWRVVLPNIRAGLLSATVLTVALVLGEFTMASLDQYVTFPVWIYNTNTINAQVTTAASLSALIVTWVLLLVISTLDSRRRSGKVVVMPESQALGGPGTLAGSGALATSGTGAAE
jgi:putative spermidine/putrescine transport system permease protein